MIEPGLTALTRIFLSASSAAKVRVRERTAALLAERIPRPATPRWSSHEVLRMIELPGGISGTTACTEKNTPLTFTSISLV